MGALVCPAGVAMFRWVMSEEISPRLWSVVGEAVGRPLRVVYADHSRLEHHGAAAGDVAVVLMRAFELDLILECVKFPPRGRVSVPAGVGAEALEECLHSSKG